MYENTTTCSTSHCKRGLKCKLSVCGFTLATALISGLGIFFLGLMATYLNIGVPYVTILGSVYHGYAATYAGSLIGGAWAFACGIICGFFFSLFYNLILKACCCRCAHCKGRCSTDAYSRDDYKDTVRDVPPAV